MAFVNDRNIIDWLYLSYPLVFNICRDTMTARENELRGHAWDRRQVMKALASGPKVRKEFNLPGTKTTQLARLNELIAMGKIERVWGGVYRLVEQ